MSSEESWEVNIPKRLPKRFNLKDLIVSDGDNYRDKVVTLNNNYLNEKYDSILRTNFSFVNFESNNHYLNFTEFELDFLNEDNRSKALNLQHFNRITFNDKFLQEDKLKQIKLSHATLISLFKIKNNNKILNVFIYNYYLEKFDTNVYMVMSYFDRKNTRVYLLTNYLELLLYIFKLEMEMNKNPKFTRILNKYPYDFANVSIKDLRVYFNNLTHVWTEN
jgi:hypothetical protein